MFEVRFTQKAIFDVEVFIQRYEMAFLALHNDSGIWSEKMIKDLYRQSANALHEKIVDEITARLSKNNKDEWKQIKQRARKQAQRADTATTISLRIPDTSLFE